MVSGRVKGVIIKVLMRVIILFWIDMVLFVLGLMGFKLVISLGFLLRIFLSLFVRVFLFIVVIEVKVVV